MGLFQGHDHSRAIRHQSTTKGKQSVICVSDRWFNSYNCLLKTSDSCEQSIDSC